MREYCYILGAVNDIIISLAKVSLHFLLLGLCCADINRYSISHTDFSARPDTMGDFFLNFIDVFIEFFFLFLFTLFIYLFCFARIFLVMLLAVVISLFLLNLEHFLSFVLIDWYHTQYCRIHHFLIFWKNIVCLYDVSGVKPCAWYSIHFFGLFVWVPNFSIIKGSFDGDYPGVCSSDEVSAAEFWFGKISASSKVISFLLFHLCLFDSVSFQYCQRLVMFLLIKHSDFIQFWYSFPCISFFPFHYHHDTFFYNTFHYNILAEYPIISTKA